METQDVMSLNDFCKLLPINSLFKSLECKLSDTELAQRIVDKLYSRMVNYWYNKDGFDMADHINYIDRLCNTRSNKFPGDSELLDSTDSHFLISLFDWCDSDEGIDYWFLIYSIIR